MATLLEQLEEARAKQKAQADKKAADKEAKKKAIELDEIKLSFDKDVLDFIVERKNLKEKIYELMKTIPKKPIVSIFSSSPFIEKR